MFKHINLQLSKSIPLTSLLISAVLALLPGIVSAQGDALEEILVISDTSRHECAGHSL